MSSTKALLPSSKLYLWKSQTLYLGTIDGAAQFCKPAASLWLGLNGLIQLKEVGANSSQTAQSFLLPPGKEFECDTDDTLIAICMLDPHGISYNNLHSKMTKQHNRLSFSILNEQAYIEAFLDIYLVDSTAETAYKKLCEVLSIASAPAFPLDQRIKKVIDLIQENIGDNISLEHLASQVNLSVPRLVQLFRQQVGAPVRRYRLYHRLFCATAEIAKTGNFTEGAISSGFSDAAHFSRTFKSMFGLTPTQIFNQANGLKIYPPPLL